MLESSIKEDWKPVLSDFEHSEAGKKIEQLLAKQKAEGLKIFPPKPYRALELLSGRSKSRHSRTGSLSRIQSGKRIGVFREQGCTAASEPEKYL